jgi:ketopantoate reductase PanE/ApbA-like protein
MWSQLGSDYGPSMLHDIENGRPNEGDHIIGDMVRRADRLGVTVPILRAALCNLQICEARRLQLEDVPNSPAQPRGRRALACCYAAMAGAPPARSASQKGQALRCDRR